MALSYMLSDLCISMHATVWTAVHALVATKATTQDAFWPKWDFSSVTQLELLLRCSFYCYNVQAGRLRSSVSLRITTGLSQKNQMLISFTHLLLVNMHLDNICADHDVQAG